MCAGLQRPNIEHNIKEPHCEQVNLDLFTRSLFLAIHFVRRSSLLSSKPKMKVLSATLVAVCFINVVAVSATLVPEIDTPQRAAPITSAENAHSELTRADCDYGKLYELTRSKQDAKQQRLVDFCRVDIETDIMEGVQRIDSVSRLQVSAIAEEIIGADVGQFIRGKSFYMPTYNRSYQEGILKALEQIYGDLSRLKSLEEFRKEYEQLIIGTCKTLVDNVRQPVRDYRVFTSSSDLFTSEEPLKWSRYTEVCTQLIDSGFEPFGSGAYRLSANRLANSRKSIRPVIKNIMKSIKKKPKGN